VRRLLLLLAIAGLVFWFIRDKPTVTGFVDRLTRPLFGSKAAVEESEHNRVYSDAVPAITEDDEKKVGMLREGAKSQDIRDLLGEPDSNEPVVEAGRQRVLWKYRRLRRWLYFEDNRVVRIVIR
jgi:hypothetical protein